MEDGTIDATSKRMRVGVMVRDTKGVLAAMYTTVTFITDPTIAEAIFAWKAIVFRKNLGL